MHLAGENGLATMAQAELGFAPKAGVMVVFRSKRGDRVKVLFWDGSGIVMI
jgi:transposase